ncbi:MAG: hypothetical protein AAGA65_13360 [Actinomycetota bacterium]
MDDHTQPGGGHRTGIPHHHTDRDYTDGRAGPSGLPEQRIVTFRDALGLAMRLADDYAHHRAAALLDGDGNLTELVTVDGFRPSIGALVERVCAHLGAVDETQDRRWPVHRPNEPKQVEQMHLEHKHSEHDHREPEHVGHAVRGVVLFTVGPVEPDLIREADLRLFRQAGWILGVAGADLLDWIETDGDVVRSYASVTCPALAWADDPPDQRMEDR